MTDTGIPPSSTTPGKCQDITQCGQIEGHTVVQPWQCGGENCPACPNGEQCLDHICIGGNVTCPPTAVVGKDQKCDVTVTGGDCANATVVITGPDGQKTTVTTDENCNFDFKPDKTGKYVFSLLGPGGQALATAVSQATGGQGGGNNPPPGLTFLGLPLWLWLLLLLLIIILLLLYWRRRKKK